MATLKLDTVGGTTPDADAPTVATTSTVMASATTSTTASASVGSAPPAVAAPSHAPSTMDEHKEFIRAMLDQEAAAQAQANAPAVGTRAPAPAQPNTTLPPTADRDAAGTTTTTTSSPNDNSTMEKSPVPQAEMNPSLVTEAMGDEYDAHMFRRSHRVLAFLQLDCCFMRRPRRSASVPGPVSMTMNVKDDMFGLDPELQHSDGMSSVFSGWSEGNDTVVSRADAATAKAGKPSRPPRPSEFLFFCGTERLEQFRPKEVTPADATLEQLDVRTLRSSVEQRELPMFFSPSTPRNIAVCTPRTSLLAFQDEQFSARQNATFEEDDETSTTVSEDTNDTALSAVEAKAS